MSADTPEQDMDLTDEWAALEIDFLALVRTAEALGRRTEAMAQRVDANAAEVWAKLVAHRERVRDAADAAARAEEKNKSARLLGIAEYFGHARSCPACVQANGVCRCGWSKNLAVMMSEPNAAPVQGRESTLSPVSSPKHTHDWRIFRWGSGAGGQLIVDLPAESPFIVERDCLGCDERQRATHDGRDIVWVRQPKRAEPSPAPSAPPAEPPSTDHEFEERHAIDDPYGFRIGLCKHCGQPRERHATREEPTVEQELREIEEKHSKRIGVNGGRTCDFCSLPGSPFGILWPCDAIKLARAVRQALNQPNWETLGSEYAEVEAGFNAAVLAALRGED